MSKPAVEHAALILDRKLKASPERVFAAWADAKQRMQWYVPGTDWVIAEYTQEFRPGGREFWRFGDKGNPQVQGEGHFLNIIENARIVSAYAMQMDGVPISTTMCTVEISPKNGGTHLVLTDQSAFLGAGETPSDRRGGWSEILERLETYLN